MIGIRKVQVFYEKLSPQSCFNKMVITNVWQNLDWCQIACKKIIKFFRNCGWGKLIMPRMQEIIYCKNSHFPRQKKHENLPIVTQMSSNQFHKSLLSSHNFTWHINILIQIDFLQQNNNMPHGVITLYDGWRIVGRF